MFNFHEGREWLLCQDKWNLLLETTEVGMKIIIKKYEKAFERISIEVALGNSSRKTVLKKIQVNKNIKGQLGWLHSLICFKHTYQDTYWLLVNTTLCWAFFLYIFIKHATRSYCFWHRCQNPELSSQKLPAV